MDILNDMQKNAPVEISIQDWNDDADQDVDFRLIKMAKNGSQDNNNRFQPR